MTFITTHWWAYTLAYLFIGGFLASLLAEDTEDELVGLCAVLWPVVVGAFIGAWVRAIVIVAWLRVRRLWRRA